MNHLHGKRKYDMDCIKYMFTLQQKHSAVNIWIAWKNSSSWLCVYMIFLNLLKLFLSHKLCCSINVEVNPSTRSLIFWDEQINNFLSRIPVAPLNPTQNSIRTTCKQRLAFLICHKAFSLSIKKQHEGWKGGRVEGWVCGSLQKQDLKESGVWPHLQHSPLLQGSVCGTVASAHVGRSNEREQGR